MDVFGRIESKHSFSAANTFKVGGWHTLLLTRSHHPLNWNMTVFMDLMHSCQKWYKLELFTSIVKISIYAQNLFMFTFTYCQQHM